MGALGRVKKKVDKRLAKTETFKLKPGEAALTFTDKGLGFIVVGKTEGEALSLPVVLAFEAHEMLVSKEVQTALIMKYKQRINNAVVDGELERYANTTVPDNPNGEADLVEEGEVETS